MSSLDERPFPRAALLGAGLLISVTMAAVGAVQLHKHYAPPPPPSAPAPGDIAEARDLRFVEVNGLVVRADDVKSGQKVADLVDSDGFVRVVLSSLAFDRHRLGIGKEPVFRLIRWRDGRLSLEDTTTGISINLGAFGQQNKSVFYRFLANATPTS